MIELKVKKLHPDAIIPKYATAGAACFDLHAITPNDVSLSDMEVFDRHGVNMLDSFKFNGAGSHTFSTGLAFEIPEGHVMLVFSRSGHGFKNDVRLSNCVGVVDNDFVGEVKVRLSMDHGLSPTLTVRHGDRIAQAMILPIPSVTLVEVDELKETERGTGGFGSTGA